MEIGKYYKSSLLYPWRAGCQKFTRTPLTPGQLSHLILLTWHIHAGQMFSATEPKSSMSRHPPFLKQMFQFVLSVLWSTCLAYSPVMATIATIIIANIYWYLLRAGCWAEPWQTPFNESCPQRCEAGTVLHSSGPGGKRGFGSLPTGGQGQHQNPNQLSHITPLSQPHWVTCPATLLWTFSPWSCLCMSSTSRCVSVFIHVAVVWGEFVDYALWHLMNSLTAPSFHPGLRVWAGPRCPTLEPWMPTGLSAHNEIPLLLHSSFWIEAPRGHNCPHHFSEPGFENSHWRSTAVGTGLPR